ncbi:LEAF RUST 10 DISEASE-RESISTANCE LOCUS RECEPTOR-LIKE PROTEIN KINASE-like 1.2 [Pistacia vera]|uniref:LEAF RUST 10 DISEASE-RESISTANCE LOCUS RECEPTOR-LIKE PROTEIN KINASE-like 1.2 n=1 Tax=Pistacia vera TaxID=55513 RepID=UPI001263A8F2|nr:LEAF RUST 10 DISEASE-RESISTANCE LOCUS RECEPTOR-LIKE PROTEIN KINASE-like 1.2 [Pistacia vera]
MKNQVPDFCVFILCVLSGTVLAKVDHFYKACSVRETCGDGQTITFPFYIREKQQPFCGYPGFEISCNSNGNPVLNLNNIDYIIHEISYNNQSVRVSNAAVSETNNSNASCIDLSSHRIQNLSLPEDRFALLSYQSELVLLYNCNSSLPGELLRYRDGICEVKNKTAGTVLALVSNDANLVNASRECSGDLVVAPVDVYAGNGGGFGIGEVIKSGFLLNWTASNFSVCEESGGRCGFDASTYHFKCFCTDRPHAQQCDPVKANGLITKVAIGNTAFNSSS